MNARQQFLEIAAIVDAVRAAGGTITAACVHDADGRLVAGAPPVDPPGTVWVSGESYERMREYARTPKPELPRMAEPVSGKQKPAPKRVSIKRRKR